MERKIRVGAVSYLNTKPLLFGINHSSILRDIELKIDYPSHIALMLLEDKIDIGLVPVAVIPQLKEYFINTNYCIGCDGPVASVCLFSETPVAQIKRVLLDYQSSSSVELARILFREYWKTEVEFIHTAEDFQDRIKGSTAGVVIGDRALELRGKTGFIYDLGEAWKALTGLPFVFAAWISNKKLDDGFISAFDQANADGLDKMETVLSQLHYPFFDLRLYYTRYIRFDLNAEKISGMQLFLKKLKG